MLITLVLAHVLQRPAPSSNENVQITLVTSVL